MHSWGEIASGLGPLPSLCLWLHVVTCLCASAAASVCSSGPGRASALPCHPGTAHTFFVGANDKPRAGELINVLREAKQEVPEELLKFGTTGAQCGVGGGG